jgi:hypothetical protein
MKCLPILATLLISCGMARSHHGDEFFLLEDYELPAPWEGSVASGFDWEKFGSLDAFSAETTALLSIAPRVSLSTAVSFSDDGDGWGYSSVTPRLHVQLTPPEWDFPIRVGLSIGYQIVDGASGYGTRRVRDVRYERIPHGSGGSPGTLSMTDVIPVVNAPAMPGGGTGPDPDPPCDPSVDVDCILPRTTAKPDLGSGKDTGPAPRHAGHAGPEPVAPSAGAAATSSGVTAAGGGGRKTTRTVRRVSYRNVPENPGYAADSIHNHVDNLWIGRLIVEGDFGKTKALFNLIGVSPEGGKPVWGYAAGVRHQFTEMFGLGVEAIGDFDVDKTHEMVVGAYINATHSLTVKWGAGFGLTSRSTDISLRTGFVWRF